MKGTLSLTANSDGANKCKVVLASTDPSGAFTFQTHPKVQYVYRVHDDARCRCCKFGTPPGSGCDVCVLSSSRLLWTFLQRLWA